MHNTHTFKFLIHIKLTIVYLEQTIIISLRYLMYYFRFFVKVTRAHFLKSGTRRIFYLTQPISFLNTYHSKVIELFPMNNTCWNQ